jgi:hypothetical protein
MLTRQYMPFLAQDSVTMSTTQKYAKLNAIKLSNPSRTPMLIDEIRFISPSALVNPFMYVDTQLKFAWNQITNSFVPIGLLGGVFNRRFLNGSYVAQTLRTQVSNLTFSFVQVWRFPKPVYLDPNEIVSVEFRLNEQFNAALATQFSTTIDNITFPITCAMVCRSLPIGTPPPKQLQMPWATHWRTVNFANAVETTDRSTVLNLVNPHREDLKIQAFVGRIFTQFDDAIENRLDQFATGTNPALYERDITVTANHVNGAQLVKDPTPFGQVFSTVDNCWYPNAILKPNDYYIFTMQADLRAYDPNVLPTPAVNSVNYGLIALNGHRTVELRP